MLNKNPTRSNSMQSDLFYCKIAVHVSGVRRNRYKEYKKRNHSLRYRS